MIAILLLVIVAILFLVIISILLLVMIAILLLVIIAILLLVISPRRSENVAAGLEKRGLKLAGPLRMSLRCSEHGCGRAGRRRKGRDGGGVEAGRCGVRGINGGTREERGRAWRGGSTGRQRCSTSMMSRNDHRR